jgi:RNA polymerase sigma-70 factor (ECF subfamily)
VTRVDDAADDRELLTRHVHGDQEAFGLLVSRHRDRLWRVALRTLGDPDDAADAVQDALVSALRAAASFRGEAAVSTWLHRIVVNACLDQARKRARRPTVALETGPDGDGSRHSGSRGAGSSGRDIPAPDLLSERETAAEVLTALRQLPIEQSAAVVLVDVEGYPVADVAAMLEVPVGTVKSRCSRGRARLAELLGHLAPEMGAPEMGAPETGAPEMGAPEMGPGNPATGLPVQPPEQYMPDENRGS